MVKPQGTFDEEMSTRVAEVLGLCLERSGLEDIQVGETAFSSPETDDPKQIAAALAKTISKTPIKTQYVLYGEIHGTPQTGPKQIYTILIDRTGKVALADRDDEQTYAQTTDMTPKNPMTCCIFLARKIKKHWDLDDPLRANPPQGKMAERMRLRSGLPPKAEVAAMEERRAALKAKAKKARLTVYPVRISRETDEDCGAALAELLRQERVCQAAVAEADPKLEIGGDPNQAKVLWDTARAFRQYVKDHPPTTDYALFADYAIGRSTSGDVQVRYVHVIVCTRAGDWVVVDLQNSHHDDFQSIGPKSPEQCNRLAVRRLKSYLAD